MLFQLNHEKELRRKVHIILHYLTFYREIQLIGIYMEYESVSQRSPEPQLLKSHCCRLPTSRSISEQAFSARPPG